MPIITQITAAWLNRQYRMTYRAVMTGLLAAGQHDAKPVAQKAHEITVAALAQMRSAEI
jgi:hypothetical protein